MSEGIRFINPPTMAQPVGYTHVVEATGGRTVYISGQVALDRDGNLVGEGDLRAQAVQVLENIKAILAHSHATMDDIVKVTVYVTDIRAFNDIADIRETYFPKDGPSSVICEVSALAWPEFMM